MTASTTRKSVRTIAGLIAVLGLVFALALPAMAMDVTPEPIDGNKSCGQLGDYDHEFKIDATPETKHYADPNSEFEVDITVNAGETVMDFAANLGVDAVFVKGGNEGGNLYVYDPATLSDTGLTTPTSQQISHVSFCFDDVPQESEPPASEPASEPPASEPAESEPASEPPASEPAESEPAESEPASEQPTPLESEEEAPSEAPSEGVLGGTPTPAPGGTLPDTATAELGGTPVAMLSLLLLASLGALVYLRFAQDPARKR